jgi:hypothetical protein
MVREIIKRVRIISTMLIVFSLWIGSWHEASASGDPCAAVKAGTKVMWGKEVLKPYQKEDHTLYVGVRSHF